MRYLTTAAIALAFAASAAAASADPPDNNKDHANHPAGQAPHGPPAGGAAGPHAGAPGGVHTGGPPVTGGAPGGHPNGQAAPGETFRGNGQSGGPGPQNYRAYGRGPGGYVAPNGQGAANSQIAPNGVAPNTGAANGQAGHPPFHVGGQAAAGAPHGGIPGANHALRGRDAGRGYYNPSLFPQQFHAQQRFHVGWYNRPSGWYQRTWGYGDYLPFGWFAPQFYLDFQDYGLPYPPVGCEWVQEGPDALLVDVWTGQVLSVAYGVFY